MRNEPHYVAPTTSPFGPKFWRTLEYVGLIEATAALTLMLLVGFSPWWTFGLLMGVLLCALGTLNADNALRARAQAELHEEAFREGYRASDLAHSAQASRTANEVLPADFASLINSQMDDVQQATSYAYAALQRVEHIQAALGELARELSEVTNERDALRAREQARCAQQREIAAILARGVEGRGTEQLRSQDLQGTAEAALPGFLTQPPQSEPRVDLAEPILG